MHIFISNKNSASFFIKTYILIMAYILMLNLILLMVALTLVRISIVTLNPHFLIYKDICIPAIVTYIKHKNVFHFDMYVCTNFVLCSYSLSFLSCVFSHFLNFPGPNQLFPPFGLVSLTVNDTWWLP